MLIKLFNQTILEPPQVHLDLRLKKDNSSELCFNHQTEFKEILLLSCEFNPAEEDEVKQHIKFRHKMANVELA